MTGWLVRLISLISPKSKTAVPTSSHRSGPTFLNCLQSIVFGGSCGSLFWARAGMTSPATEMNIAAILSMGTSPSSGAVRLSLRSDCDFTCLWAPNGDRRPKSDSASCTCCKTVACSGTSAILSCDHQHPILQTCEVWSLNQRDHEDCRQAKQVG